MFKKVPSTIDVYYILQSFTGLTTSPNTVFFIQRVQSFVSKNSYIYIVGEVRGPEAIDMLQALNTGHDGSLSTGHANSTADMLSRLETMVLMGMDIPLGAIRRQIASGIDIIVHLGRLRDKSRKLMEVTEVLDYQEGEIRLNPLYSFEETGEKDGKIIGDGKKLHEIRHKEKLLAAGYQDAGKSSDDA